MKKLLSLALALLMLLSLAACGQSSEETGSKDSPAAAKPAEPAPCQHDWVEANCQTPRTCLVCGETDGETREHSYGEWSIINDSEMSRVCAVCGETETAALDHEQILAQHIVGYWDTHSISSASKEVSIYNYPLPMYMMTCYNEDGTGYTRTGTINSEWTWELKDYELINSVPTYTIHSDYSDGTGADFTLVLGEENEPDYLISTVEGFGAQLMTQNKELLHFFPGRYVCGENYLELRADRSVSGYINGEVEGFWVTMPVVQSSGGYIFGMCVSCSTVGDYDLTDIESIINSNFAAYSSRDAYLIGETADELANFDPANISINIADYNLSFVKES